MEKIKTLIMTARSLGVSVEFLNNHKIRYDLGKYQPGAQKKVHEDPNYIKACERGKIIWYEWRRDSDGPYIALCTIDNKHLQSIGRMIYAAPNRKA